MLSTKDYVLSRLISCNGYISGQSLSEDLGISRAAINAAVKTLRSEGYDISSTTNLGYKLNNHPDQISRGELLAYLPDDRMNDVIVLMEVDSTNKYLKGIAYDGAPSGTVVIADHQTAGRGRLGRSFHSPSGCGIYLSYLMRPSISPELVSRITCWAAVAVANAISSVCGVTPSIKWVNDPQINGKKISGILTEMSIESETGSISSVVIGIGINVNENPSVFPEEIRNTASSIRHETGKTEPILRSLLASELIKELDIMSSRFPEAHDEYLTSYRKLCSTVGLEVSVVSAHNHESEIPRLGKAIAVNDDFSLKVRMSDGHEEDLRSGEVSVRRI